MEAMTRAHWESVRAIYEEGIRTAHATFEAVVPDREAWDREHLPDPRVVAREGDGILGWAALTPVSERCVYSGVAEVSVYVASTARGRGVGKALLEAIIQGSARVGIWTLQAKIIPENTASLALHETCGFRVVGRRERIARIGGVWKDVILLERRSPIVGKEDGPLA